GANLVDSYGMEASPSFRRAAPGSASGFDLELELSFDAIAEGICVLNQEAGVLFCNRAFLQMTGYEHESALGRNLCALLHPALPVQESRATHACGLPKGAGDLQSKDLMSEQFRRKDGSCFPARCWLRSWNSSSGLIRYLLTVRDMSELKEANEAMDRSEKRFRRILTNAPDVAWTSDARGRTVYISPKVEAVLGYTKEEFCVGQQLRLGRIHPADFGRVYDAYESL